MQNSWGNGWGKDGYCWIPYSMMATIDPQGMNFCYAALVMVGNGGPKPPVNDLDDVRPKPLDEQIFPIPKPRPPSPPKNRGTNPIDQFPVELEQPPGLLQPPVFQPNPNPSQFPRNPPKGGR